MIAYIKTLLLQIKEKGFFHLLSANYLIQILMFGSQMFVAWILTPEDIGRIKIMQSYLGVAIIFAGFGFNTSTLKLISEKRPFAEKYALFSVVLKYNYIALIFVYIIMLVFSLLNLISKDMVINHIFPVYSIMLFPITLNTLMIAYLQGLKKIKEMAKIQTITSFISLTIIIILTYFFYLYGYITALILGFITTYLFLSLTIKNINRDVTEISLDKSFQIHWQYAKFSFLANGLSRISLFMDIFLMNYLISDRTAVGYYGFALTVIVAFRLITGTVQQICTPFFSEKSTNFNEWKSIYKKYNFLFQVGSLIITIISIFLLPEIINFVFQGKYDNSTPFLRILVISWFVRNLYSIKGIALLGLGKIHLNFYSSLIVLPISIITTYYGNLVSAISSMVITSTMFNVVYKKDQPQYSKN
jgi:O-antigen/teichoic acid export membrane protein